jgi:hypothetical protein
MDFRTQDDFYFLQIIKRKKEHPEMPKSVKVVHTFYIDSKEKLLDLQEEIIHICEYHNARAYINLNRRSFEKLAYQTLKQVTDCILNKEYRYIRKSYNTVCSRFSNESGEDKVWIVDLDSKEETSLREILDIFLKINPYDKIVKTVIETKNGYHIITKPFRVDEFRKYYPSGIDIHKDNPTILYIS